MNRLRAFGVTAMALAACSSSNPSEGPAADLASAPDLAMAAPVRDPLVEARPFGLTVPKSYDSAKRWPLVLLLHGYSASGATQDQYFGLSARADEVGVFVATPDGTMDANGNRFWNATDACCDLGKIGPDDVTYLTAVVSDVRARYQIDERRIFVVGHSNGGFMAHRLACDRAQLFAAAVSLAGSTWKDPARCQPAAPIAVAQAHGPLDTLVLYGGGTIAGGGDYPSVADTYGFWSKAAGCTGEEMGAPFDLDSFIFGSETQVRRASGCSGGAAELWRIEGAGHIPALGPGWATAVFDFFLSHPKP